MANRIEVSRKVASDLHQQAVQRGADPTKPYSFAVSVAKEFDLEVERVPIGDVRLRGGRAYYDPDALLILHEDADDEFSRAFLVAHEIGHVQCGGDREPLLVEEVDAERSGESSGVGVDRVVDYSHRQRREIQMDLFAREFLLPRDRLRTLHVDECLTASQIAQRFGAPFPVVAQQLLDALLMPSISLEAEGELVQRDPNAKQWDAIKHRGDAYLLEADPGTGKTQTLVRRIESLLEDGVDPERILVLTFSNKAANELSERIAKSDADAASAMWVGTFHSFGLDLVRRFHDRLDLPSDPRLLDRSAAIALLETVYAKFKLVHLKELVNPAKTLTKALDAISRANDEVVNAAEYARLSRKMLDSVREDDEIERAEKCDEIAQIFSKCEELKQANGLIDFGDLVSLPVRLCEDHTDIAAYLSGLYEHILVDEFQDVNRASVRLLKALAGSGRNLWVVGDAKQSIYRFRGASSFNMTRFLKEDFPAAKTGSLDINYRSVPEVVDTVRQFSTTMRVVDERGPTFTPDRDAIGHKPEHRIVETAEDELAALADGIVEMQKAGYKLSDQAILCTGQDRLARTGRALERMGIPVLHLGNLFERDEVRDLLSLLNLVVDSRAMGLLRVASLPGFETDLEDVAGVLDYLRESASEPMEWAGRLAQIDGLSKSGKESLTKIGEIQSNFPRIAEPWKVLTTILLDRSRMAASLSQDDSVKSKSNGIAIWQLMNFVRTQPRGRGLPITRLLDRIRQLVLHSDERDLRRLPAAADGINAVRLLTMHASKGLEFPVVHLPGLTSSSIPRSANASLARSVPAPDGMIDGATGSGYNAAREGLDEEQECLFFVALSRAKDRLFLYRARCKSNGHSNPASKFLANLGTTITTRQVIPQSEFSPEPIVAPVPVSLEDPFTFTDYQLALYERCPRRFLYAHVLRTGGRRKESAFMKLHVAVEHVLNDLLAQRDALPSTDEIESLIRASLESQGIESDGEYHSVACELLEFFVDSKASLRASEPNEVSLPVEGGQITVTPDHQLIDDTGKVLFRRIKTGHKMSDEEKSLEFSLLQIAAESGSLGAMAQVVHLSDAKVSDVQLTKRRLQGKKEKLGSVCTAIQNGQYPPKPSVTCPRCPAYFVCGPLPAGELRKKVSG